LAVGGLLDVVVKEVQDRFALLLLQANDATGELAVDKERLLAGDGVGADDGVD
jgi:hypothetical protein